MFVPGVFTQSRNAFYGYATYIEPDEEEPVLQVKLGETDVSDLPVLSQSPHYTYTFTQEGFAYAFQIVAGTVKAWKGQVKQPNRLTISGLTSGEKLYGLTGVAENLNITATNAKSVTQGAIYYTGDFQENKPTIYS